MRSWGGKAGIVLIAAAALGMLGLELVVPRVTVHATLLSRRNTPAEEEEQRRIRDPRDDVAEIYGIPVGGAPWGLLGVETDRWVIPREAPDRRLLLVAPGQPPPLQARTVRYLGRVGVAALAAVGLLLWGWSRRRPTGGTGLPPTAPPPPA